MWFIGVEVEQETSAPPPKKNPGSAPEDVIQIQHNRIKNPNWQEATSWLFTSVAKDLNSGWQRTNPASRGSGSRACDCCIVSPTR